jgi:Tfp pilus assembly protein PilN
MLKYRLNLVKTVRDAEKRAQRQVANMALIAFFCFAALGLAVFFSYIRVASMRLVIEKEKQKLAAIEAEYHSYQETNVSIDKADIELLNSLQGNRVYWTRKLEAMAKHLPNDDPVSYWITGFGYKGNTYGVRGYGYITQRQEQLLALDDYLNNLRDDAAYSDIFGATYLNSAVRSDEDVDGKGLRERVSFEYSSTRKGF